MQQPLADYQAGLRPNWSDCLAWQNGEPANYVWSYGASVTTTTTSTTTTTTTVEPSTTTTLPATTSILTTTSTTDEPTTTRPTETTTVYIAPITTPVVLPVQEPVVVVPTGTIAQVIEVRPIETTLPVPVSTSIPKIDIPLTTETRPPETVPPPIETIAPPTSIADPFVPRSSTTAPTPTVPQTILPVETTLPIPPTTLLVDTPGTGSQAPPISLPATIPADISNEQIAELVSNPETLKALTVDQAEQLFEKLDVTELDNTELEAFTEAIQVAPVEVRKAFEKKVNIFGSQFDNTPSFILRQRDSCDMKDLFFG